jgi:hypothetical protein
MTFNLYKLKGFPRPTKKKFTGGEEEKEGGRERERHI